MKLNFLQAAGWGFQLLSALQAAEMPGSQTRGGDTALYIACRELAIRLEQRNSGIVTQAGYYKAIGSLERNSFS